MSDAAHSDAFYMRRVIDLARQAWGQTHPNPMVGALIVDDGEIVAEGWHQGAGQPHAEVEAFAALKKELSPNAALYITLEPCSTKGRTGACTDVILKSGIRRVVVGAIDPNPEHAGRGLEILRENGIEVVDGILRAECTDLNLIFNHWIVSGEPLLAAKMAMTLDGKFAAASGHSQWVTGEAARANVMKWRRYFPAIAVGASTVLQDDPSLTSRTEDAVHCPKRFVFDRQLRTIEAGRQLTVYSDAFADRTTLVCLESANAELKEKALSQGLTIWETPEDKGHIDWSAFRKRCAGESICGVYVEVGPALATEVIESGKVDYLFVYKAAKFLSDSSAYGMGSDRQTTTMDQCHHLQSVRHEVFGSDVLTRGVLSR